MGIGKEYNTMRTRLLLLFCLLILTGCFQKNNTAKETEVKNEEVKNSKTNSADTMQNVGPAWASDLVLKYVQESKNENITAARNDNAPVAWMFDGTRPSDTAVYYVFHIGNDREDHFSTAGWVYIDSARHSIYEYDIAKDSMYLWKS